MARVVRPRRSVQALVLRQLRAASERPLLVQVDHTVWHQVLGGMRAPVDVAVRGQVVNPLWDYIVLHPRALEIPAIGRIEAVVEQPA